MMRTFSCGHFALALLLVSAAAAQDISDFRAQLAHERATQLLMDDPGLQYDPGSILVQWHPGQAEEERIAMREVVGSGVLKRYPLVPNLELIHITISGSQCHGYKPASAGPLAAGGQCDQPPDGATVEGFVTISATATDNVSVAQVEFLVDGLVIATDATAPYSTSWNSSQTTVGIHVLTARATDPAGNTGTSTAITVTVTTPPSLTLTLSGWPGVINRGDLLTGSAIITNTGGANASGLVASVSWSPSNVLRLEQGGPNNSVPTVVAGGSQTTGWALKGNRQTSLVTITVSLSEASGNVITTETTTMVILK